MWSSPLEATANWVQNKATTFSPLRCRRIVTRTSSGLPRSVHVVVHGEDLVERVFVGIDVDHPAEDNRLEASTRRVASVSRGDGALQTELGPVSRSDLVLWRRAKIGVQMPHGHAERDPRVELIFARALGHGVHRADELIARPCFLVQKGSRPRRIERESLQKAGPIRSA